MKKEREAEEQRLLVLKKESDLIIAVPQIKVEESDVVVPIHELNVPKNGRCAVCCVLYSRVSSIIYCALANITYCDN